MTRHGLGSAVVFVLSVEVFAGADVPTPTASEVAEINRCFRADPFSAEAFERFKAILPKEGDLYVLEGDTLLSEDEIREFVTAVPRQMKGDQVHGVPVTAQANHAGPELIVNVVNGMMDSWGVALQLTYAVDAKSFGSSAKYQEVVDAMAAAARDWTDACPQCGISFTHRKGRDEDHPAPDGDLTFVVTLMSSESGYIAAAFYPNDDASRHLVRLGPRYFRPDTDRVGVLRHELGYILGYRHEQIRGVPGCDLEDRNWRALTGYDRHSVMHYLCGDGGDQVLQLTSTDKAGHRLLYGPHPTP